MTEEELRIQQRARSRVMGILLILLVILIFAISIVKIAVA